MEYSIYPNLFSAVRRAPTGPDFLKDQAARFRVEQAQAIGATRTKLTLALKLFLTREGTRIAQKALTAITQNLDADLELTSRLLRSEAISFRPDVSATYWTMVDGLTFYFDAIGEHWRYLTPEQRQRYLDWADQHATEVLSTYH